MVVAAPPARVPLPHGALPPLPPAHRGALAAAARAHVRGAGLPVLLRRGGAGGRPHAAHRGGLHGGARHVRLHGQRWGAVQVQCS
jgi:hypothetical protein